jgi:hypothetical protein
MNRKRKFEQRESIIVTFKGWQGEDLHIEADRQRVPISELMRNIVSGFLSREVVLPDSGRPSAIRTAARDAGRVLPDDSAQFDYLDKYTPPD